MAEASHVIHLNMDARQFELYSLPGSNYDDLVLDALAYKGKPFSDEFYECYSQTISSWNEKFNFAGSSVSTLLPDGVVSLSTFTVPSMKRANQKVAVDNALDNLYKVKDDLRLNVAPLSSTRTTTTYLSTAIRSDVIAGLQAEIGQYRPAKNVVTFEAASTARAATQLCPKTKNSAYLLMDIRRDTTQFVFINKGVAVGTRSLPFGYEMLKSNRIVDEYMLFDHDVAQLAVLNAREKARSKALTMLSDEGAMEASMAISSNAPTEAPAPDTSAVDNALDELLGKKGKPKPAEEPGENPWAKPEGEEEKHGKVLGLDEHGKPIYADDESEAVADGAQDAPAEETPKAGKSVAEDDDAMLPTSVSLSPQEEAGVQRQILGYDEAGNPIYGDVIESDPDDEAPVATAPVTKIKVLPRKQPRKFPKYMLRPTPETPEQLIYENFRIFMKWALVFFDANIVQANLCKPPVVCVNMPEKLGFLINMANEEKDENKVEFVSLGLEGQHPGIARHLEFYGAIGSPSFNVGISY